MNPAQRARLDILPSAEGMRPGSPEPRQLAPGADLRTDLPRYSVYENGKRRDVGDIKDLWRPDLVAFLIGSGITFDSALERAGCPPTGIAGC